MANKSKMRSLLIGGASAIAITSVLLAYWSCTQHRTDTENLSSEVTTTTTVTETTTTTSTTTSTTTTTETTTTTAVATEVYVQPETQPYVPEIAPTVVEEPVEVSGDLPITETEYILLCNVVSHEAGSSWISEWERSSIVAAIMNRVYDSRFPNTIEEVIYQPNQVFAAPYYRVDYSGIGYEPIDSAVDAYFANPDAYGSINSWFGDGYHNTFYTM